MNITEKVAFLDQITDDQWQPELKRVIQSLTSLTNNTHKKPGLVESIRILCKLQTWVTLYHVNKHYGISAYLCGALLTFPLLIYRYFGNPKPISADEGLEFFELAILAGFFFHYFFFNPQKFKPVANNDAGQVLIPDYNFSLFFNTEIKKSIARRSQECDSEVESLNTAIEQVQNQIRRSIDPHDLDELKQQLKTMQDSKIESLRLRALINRSDSVFQSDAEKADVIKQYLGINP